MDRPVVAVVLAGGDGPGLYPAARSDRPKQFQSLVGEQSMLTETVGRVPFADETYVLTRPDYADQVTEHAPDAAVLTEPEPRDTGPALVYAAHRIRDQVGECVLLCLPSDSYVSGDFESTALTAAETAVETEGLVTVGVEPTRSEPDYCYLKPGEDHGEYYGVEKSKESPGRGAAERYRYHGYYWNTGMFAWTPDALLAAARGTELGPLVETLEAGDAASGFADAPAVTVEAAILEETDDAYLVPADFEWDDVGSWAALDRLLETDETDNVVLGDALTIDAANNLVAGDGHVTAIGVEDLVIASYRDRTLVAAKHQSQRVREAVAALREREMF